MPELVRFVKSLDFRALWESEHSAKSTAWPVEPGAVEVGPSGDLWMIDEANARVVVLDRKLTLLRWIGGGRSADRACSASTDLALSPSGEIVYVVDAADGRVKAFDASGRPSSPSAAGNGPTDFVRPSASLSARMRTSVTDEGDTRSSGSTPSAVRGRLSVAPGSDESSSSSPEARPSTPGDASSSSTGATTAARC